MSAATRFPSAATTLLVLATLAGTLIAAAPLAAPLTAQTPRARDLGVPFDGTPGLLNAITDVPGIEVGHTTIISGDGPLVLGQGPIRTGVTAIHPRGRASQDPVYAAWFPLNGNGEMTGTTWIDESGLLTTPVLITNTHSVGMAHHGMLRWLVQNQRDFFWALPVVAETWDGVLNDVNGLHVTAEHAMAALDAARGGPVAEGGVGGGTGMVCHGFKGGIGTSSRVVETAGATHTVGVLVQCNYGLQRLLRVAGVPVGRELLDAGFVGRCLATPRPPPREWLRGLPRCDQTGDDAGADPTLDAEYGSIIIIVATDAPLLPHQLERVVKRAALGLARNGSVASNGSGDIFLAFSTSGPGDVPGGTAVERIRDGQIDPIFEATVEATEEAIINAMVAAETMTGADDVRVRRLPHDRLREILRRYNRLSPGHRR